MFAQGVPSAIGICERKSKMDRLAEGRAFNPAGEEAFGFSPRGFGAGALAARGVSASGPAECSGRAVSLAEPKSKGLSGAHQLEMQSKVNGIEHPSVVGNADCGSE